MRKGTRKRLLSLCLSAILALGMDAAPLYAAEYTDSTEQAAKNVEREKDEADGGSSIEENTSPIEPKLQTPAVQSDEPAGIETQTGDAVILVTVGSTSTEYRDIYEAWTAANGKTATVRLLKNVSLDNGSLTLNDPSSDITLEMADNVTLTKATSIAISVSAGSLTLASGTISAPNTNGRGIEISGGNISIQGGIINAGQCGVFARGGEIRISGGTITAQKDTGSSRGVYATGDSIVKISGGTVKAYTPDTPEGTGTAGLQATNNSKVEISGGTVSSNYIGLTINTQSGASAEISGGSFSGFYAVVTSSDSITKLLRPGYAYYDAGGQLISPRPSGSILLNTATVKECSHSYAWTDGAQTHIYGCTICDTIDESRTHTPGGSTDCPLCTAAHTVQVDTDGEITGYATLAAAFEAASGKTATITLLKSTTLPDNTCLSLNHADSNLTLQMSGNVTLSGSAAGSGLINVTAGRLTIDSGTISNTGNGAAVYTENSILTLNNGTLTAVKAISMKNGNVIINAGTVQGVCNTGTTAYGIYADNGTVAINGGAVRSSGSAGITHSGVSINGGSLTINGGTVNSDAHGVQIIGGGSAIITGGTVSGSTYGIHVTGGTVSVSGADTKVEAGNNRGDGIYVGTSGSAAVGGGTITSNGRYSIATDGGTVEITGGTMSDGVQVNGGSALISGGSISGAFGLSVDNQGNATIKENAQISGTSTGLSVNDGTVIIQGGTITGQGNAGGGVYGMNVFPNGKVIIHGGTISGSSSNVATPYSHGIYVNGGSVELNNGIIKASYKGADTSNTIYNYGVSVGGGEIRINGGSITASCKEGSDSTAVYGWGVYINQNGKAILSGGTCEGTSSAIHTNNGTVAELLAESCAYRDSSQNIIQDTDGSSLQGPIYIVKVKDISGITWEMTDLVYNGQTQGPVLTGDIPDGVTVTKTGDSAVYAGNYTASAAFTLADGYSPEEYVLIGGDVIKKDWSIKKAPKPSNTPSDTIETAYASRKIADVTLPENWEWEETAKTLELAEGVPTEAAALYKGEDAGNYETESVTIRVTRAHCPHSGTEIKGAKEASCTEAGYTGDTVCTSCGTVLTPGAAIPAPGHDYSAQVIRQPTGTSEGTMLYTCSRCKDTYTESIPRLENNGDVLPEDIPEKGIPEGLWIAGLKTNYTYTGSSVKPSFRVYSGNRSLQEKRDYTVSYKNNINAGTASLTVKGKGNYANSETRTFEILPVPLHSDEVKADNVTISWNGKTQKPLPTVSFYNRKLKNKKDYTVSYRYMGKDTDTVQEDGSYEIILTAKENGNFSGTKSIPLTVTKCILMSKVKVSRIKAQSYADWNGQEIKPSLTVKMKGKPDLTEGLDYDTEYKNNTSVGTATVILTGKNDYAGTKTVTFKITGENIKKASVTGLTDPVYSGFAHTPKPAVSLNGKDLKEDVNYTLAYEKNIAAGKATVIITGINDCTGVIKKAFRITPFDLAKDNAQEKGDRLISGLDEDITVKYVKGGCKPKPELSCQGIPMKEGTDYTIQYKNSRTAPVMIIKGKGNFKGTITKPFTIETKALNDQTSPVTIFAADTGYVNRPGKFMSTPVLTDADGTKLVYGKDYENIVYSRLTDPEVTLTKADQVQIGELIKVKVSGKGMYAGGELETVYRITEADFRKARIRISPQEYTGTAVTLDQSAILSVKINGKDITGQYGESYEIMPDSYKNNIQKGTASVVIRGKGSYGGTVTVKFKIGKRKFGGFLWF